WSETERDSASPDDDKEAPLPSGRHEKPRTGAQTARREAGAKRVPPTTGEGAYKKILMLLRNHSGADFSLYKSSTIQRRIARRIVLNRMDSLDEYARFLRGNAKELDGLYSDVLISVTGFFRNPEAFEVLKRK